MSHSPNADCAQGGHQPPRDSGVTADLRSRLDDHNAGRCPHTAKARPWAVDVIVKFADERRAPTFERYP